MKLSKLSLLKERSRTFGLIKTWQVHSHQYNKNEFCFSYGQFFIEKRIIAKPLDCKLTLIKNENFSMEKQTTKASQKLY